MRRCRKRSLTDEQYWVIWFALIGGENRKPCRNAYVGGPEQTALLEPMVKTGLLEFVCEVDSPLGELRRYNVTEAGAAAVGVSLP